MIDQQSSNKYELLCAWCGPLFVLIFIISFGYLGHNLPSPPSPDLSASEISNHYINNIADLKLGWLISLVFVSLYIPWSAQISENIRRIETHSRILTYTQLIAGALTVLVVSFGMLCWGVATLRPERDQAIIQTLHDIGWESLELQWCITTVQMVVMALAGLSDKSENPIFPSWVCFLSIACGLSFAPASLTLYFLSGPFAWNGVLGFYIPYAAWLVWCLVTSFYLIKNINKKIVVT